MMQIALAMQYILVSNYFNCLNIITMENHYGGVKTKQQMADEYGVCRKTFNKLLHRKRIKLDKGLIYPKEQVIIYKKLGIPSSIQKIPHFPRSPF
jgi:hypothetical protein